MKILTCFVIFGLLAGSTARAQSTGTNQSYSVTIQPGLNPIANQLDHGSNTLNEVVPSVPDGTILYKFSNLSGNWLAAYYSASAGSWIPDDLTLSAGEGAFLQSASSYSITFTGTPHVPVLPVTIPSGYCYLLSRQTNDVGSYKNITGFTPTNGATIYQWNWASQNYNSAQFLNGSWGTAGSSGLTAAVGEPFWISPDGTGTPAVVPTAALLPFHGILHQSTGSATLAVDGSNNLLVGNLGSSGQDGVQISLPSKRVWEAEWLDPDSSGTLPVGAYIKENIIGTGGTVTNGLLGMITTTKMGASNYVMTADFSPMGINSCTVGVYNGDVLVAQQPGISNGSPGIATLDISVSVHIYFHPFRVVGDGSVGPVTIDPTGVELTAAGNNYGFTPEGPAASSMTASFLQIQAYQIPGLTFTNEDVIATFGGLPNTTLGNAALVVSNNTIKVSNLGSSGQDGVSIAFPGNSTGWAINWLDLDPSNTLPIGAYLQQQIIGSYGSISNDLLGTLLTTKMGSSNFVMTADFTPLGISQLQLQGYDESVLLGETNLTGGPVFALGISSGGQEDWEWDSTKMMMKHTWWTPPPLPFPFPNCDALAFIPGGITSLPISAVKITASQIPAFIFTNESATVYYQGLAVTSLGNASLILPGGGAGSPSSFLYVSNLTSGGQDGVSFSMPDYLTGFDAGWNELDPSNALPTGAYVQEKIIGTNGWLGTLTVTKAGTTNYVLSADYSPVGASNYTVQAYLNGVLVGQVIHQSGASLMVSGGNIRSFDWECWPKFGPTVDWADGQPVLLGGSQLTCDRIYVIPENVSLPNTPSAVQITASQIPVLVFTNISASLVYQGLTNTSLGAGLVSRQTNDVGWITGLIITNLGSSGQDGVSIAWNPNMVGLAISCPPSSGTNGLPPGAFFQENVIGTANGITNGTLGTVNVTSSSGSTGTAGFAVAADFSALGASAYNIRAYLNGILVAQETNQSGASLGVANCGPGTLDLIIPEASIHWPTNCLFTFNDSTSVTCEHIEITPENVSLPGTLSALQVTASGVSSFTIASENATYVYQGLTNTTLGYAAMADTNKTLIVSNLSSGGQDGVSISMPTNQTALEVHWQNLEAAGALPVGAFIQQQLVGTSGTLINSALGSITVTKGGTNNYIVSADFSASGASSYTVQAYLQGALVGQATGQPGTAIATAGSWPYSADSEGDIPICTGSFDWGSNKTPVLLANTTTSVLCDHLFITPENVSLSSALTAMQITAYQVPSFTITGENSSLVYQGLTNTALGNATIVKTNKTITISNLGSSGQDGVSILLGPGNDFAAGFQDLDPGNALPAGAYLQSQLIGSAGTVTNGLLGFEQVTKLGTTNYSISVDYSAMGSSSHTIQVFNGTVLVAQLTGQPSPLCATVKLPPGTCTINVELNMEWNKATLIALNGGPAVLGTGILFIPESAAAITAVTADQFLSANIPSLVITNETVSTTYGGITHTALGDATIAKTNKTITIGNLGSSGQDGVALTLPSIQWAAAWDSLSQSGPIPAGAYIETQLIGTANGINNGVLGTSTATQGSTGCSISADLSALGATALTVRVYNGTTLAGQVSNLPMGPIVSGPGFPCGMSTCTSFAPDWIYCDEESVFVGGQAFFGNRVLIVPQGGSTNGTASTVNLFASQIPAITITNEVVSPLTVTIAVSGTNLTLGWLGTGTLQQSSDLKAWSDVTNATSPFTTPVPLTRDFYRIRQPMGNENF